MGEKILQRPAKWSVSRLPPSPARLAERLLRSPCKLCSAGWFILPIMRSENLLGSWALVPGRPKQQSAYKLANQQYSKPVEEKKLLSKNNIRYVKG